MWATLTTTSGGGCAGGRSGFAPGPAVVSLILEVSNFPMKRPLRFAAIVLALLAQAAFVCEAREGETGLRCPGGEPGQPRPEVRLSLGDITRKALELPRPRYPSEARAAAVTGDVHAEVVVDMMDGRVVWARIVDGHPLLQGAVKEVVCRARFSHVVTSGGPMRVSGTLTYKFRLPRRRRR